MKEKKNREIRKEKKLNKKLAKQELKKNKKPTFVGKVFRAIHSFLFVKKEKEHSEKFNRVMNFLNRFSLLFHLLLSLVVIFIVELLSRAKFLATVTFVMEHPLAFLYNSFIVFASLSLVYLFRRRGFARILVCAFWILIGIVNGCILAQRVTPFTFSDISCLDDLLSMTNTNYFTKEQAMLIVVGAVVFIVFMIAMFIKGPRYMGKKNPILMPIAVATMLLVGVPSVTEVVKATHVVDTYYSNIAQGYKDNGLIYSFAASALNRGMSMPEDYSQERLEGLVSEEILSELVTAEIAEKDRRPNIICILLESVVDPEEIGTFTTSSDPIPFLHYLEENFTTGYCKVPVVGAGTANTEFEVLTGMSVQYFGTGELPYKSILLSQDCESVASDLSKIGYGTHVVHNNGGNFYSRANAFRKMGFDTFTSKECLNIQKFTPLGSWAEDDILVEATLNAMMSTPGQSDFVYTITVGTHGDYPTYQVIDTPTYKILDCDSEEKTNQWTYYINQLAKTDLFVKNLTEALEEFQEDTVVVMFGDHLPTMGLTDENMASGDIYKTKYWTWNNFGLEKQDADLYAYQLLASTTNQLDIHEGTVLKYHQAHMLDEDQEAYMKAIELLQYDLLYGKRFAYFGEDLYPASELIMGINEVVVSNVTQYPNAGMALVTGSGFTPWTRVYVNGEKVGTKFVNGNIISISNQRINDGDKVIVSILGAGGTIFRSSNEYTYIDPNVDHSTEMEDTESTETETLEDEVRD